MAAPRKHAQDGDPGPHLKIEDGHDQKRVRLSPAPSMGSSRSPLGPANDPASASNTRTPVATASDNFFLLDSDESDDDDPDIIDLTKTGDENLPAPRRTIHTAVKRETGHLTPRAASNSSASKGQSVKWEGDLPLLGAGLQTPTRPTSFRHPASAPVAAPAGPTYHKHPHAPGIVPKVKSEPSPSSTRLPGFEPATHRSAARNLGAGALKTDQRPGTVKYEQKPCTTKYDQKPGNHQRNMLDNFSPMNVGFNPVLGEVPTFPSAPPPNATEDELNFYWKNLVPMAEKGENEMAVEEIVKTLTVDEQRLSKMPKAKQPAELRTNLLDHQLQALEWLRRMEKPKLPGPADPEPVQFWKRHESGAYINVATNQMETTKAPELCSGGILADDMGLGKTIEIISLILTAPGPGPTLIVAPKGVMSNWEKQLVQHVHWSKYPKILRFHQKSAVKDADMLKSYKVVITTFHKMVTDANILTAVKWRRVVLDEGHNIRNANTKMAQVACRLDAKSRWVCTGTPIINNLGDLHSLAKFLRVSGGLAHGGVFRKIMKDNPTVLQAFMVQFCLRRTKSMRFVNLKLPERDEDVDRIEFSEHEREKYQVLLEDARKAATMFFNSDGDISLWNNVLERLLRLRQLCCHWTLCRKKALALIRVQIEKRREAYSATEREMRETLVALINSNGVCGICDDPLDLPNKPVLTTCRHAFCKDCLDSKLQSQGEVQCPRCNSEFRREKVVELDVTEPEDMDEDEEGGEGGKGSVGYVPPNRRPSAKTEGIMAMIDNTIRRSRRSKIVVFSQWTSFLDIIESRLESKGVGFTRIDGTMATGERDDAVKELETNSHTRVMLASLRAAGVGISLVAADTVVLADTWWAPAIEDQAIDRVYRLGQERNVTVRRLVIQDSIEEKVLYIQDVKRELVGTAFQEDFKVLMSAEDRERILRKLLW